MTDLRESAGFRKLQLAIEQSWSAFTTPETRWSPDNPAIGQCAVTSCVVQDYYGGDILHTVAKLPNRDREGHFYNFIDGEEIDLTRQQFPLGTVLREGRPKTKEFATTRDYIFSFGWNCMGYAVLKNSVEVALASQRYSSRRHSLEDDRIKV